MDVRRLMMAGLAAGLRVSPTAATENFKCGNVAMGGGLLPGRRILDEAAPRPRRGRAGWRTSN